MREIVKAAVDRSGNIDFGILFDMGTQISVIKRHGEIETNLMISAIIQDCVANFSTYQQMTDGQIVDLTEDIMEELWWVRMEELVVFFNGVKKSRYVKIHSRFDAAIIWECWNMFAEERLKWCHAHNGQHKDKDLAAERIGKLLLSQGIKDNLKQINAHHENHKRLKEGGGA